MPPGPCQTAGRMRGKGWFDEHEEKILINRILRDDPSKGDMHNRQGVDLQRLWKCIKDYDLWPLYLVWHPHHFRSTSADIHQVGLTNYIPPSPPQNYLSYILRQMGFSTFEANLLTIPSQFLFGVNVSTLSLDIGGVDQLTGPAPHHFLGQRTGQRTRHRLFHLQHLDLPLARRPRRLGRQGQRMGPICAPDWPPLLPILPRHPRLLELKELKRRAHKSGVGSAVQYVRAVRQHHWLQHLSRG